MKAEYNKWYKCQEGNMPEDFENCHWKACYTKKVVISVAYDNGFIDILKNWRNVSKKH